MTSTLILILVLLVALIAALLQWDDAKAERNAYRSELETLKGCSAKVTLQGVVYSERRRTTDRTENEKTEKIQCSEGNPKIG